MGAGSAVQCSAVQCLAPIAVCLHLVLHSYKNQHSRRESMTRAKSKKGSTEETDEISPNECSIIRKQSGRAGKILVHGISLGSGLTDGRDAIDGWPGSRAKNSGAFTDVMAKPLLTSGRE